jgi:Rap1a immunity proteins
MGRQSAIAVMILTAFISQAWAADIFSVQALYENCKAPDRSPRNALCLGYISGVGNVMQYVGSVSRKHPDENYNPLAICGEITNGAMVQAFENWAQKNPREWTSPQSIWVMAALGETWPCR